MGECVFFYIFFIRKCVCVCLWFLSHWPNYFGTKTPQLPASLLKSLTPLTSQSQRWNAPPTTTQQPCTARLFITIAPTPPRTSPPPPQPSLCFSLPVFSEVQLNASALFLLYSHLVSFLLHLPPLTLFFAPPPPSPLPTSAPLLILPPFSGPLLHLPCPSQVS